MWTWNSMSQCGEIKINASMYHCLISSQAYWHSIVHSKAFIFHNNLVMGAIMKSKSLMKHLWYCAMQLKTWMSLGVFDVSMWTIADIFFRSDSLKIMLKCTKNVHFSGFKLISNFLHSLKHSHNFDKWVFELLNMLKSSKNSFMNTPR